MGFLFGHVKHDIGRDIIFLDEMLHFLKLFLVYSEHYRVTVSGFYKLFRNQTQRVCNIVFFYDQARNSFRLGIDDTIFKGTDTVVGTVNMCFFMLWSPFKDRIIIVASKNIGNRISQVIFKASFYRYVGDISTLRAPIRMMISQVF